MKILLSGLFLGIIMSALQSQLGVSFFNSYVFFLLGVGFCIFHFLTHDKDDK
jgi:hypothetical protein